MPARKRPEGRVVLQGREPGGQRWKSAVADLTALEARAFLKPAGMRNWKDWAAAQRATWKLREAIRVMVFASLLAIALTFTLACAGQKRQPEPINLPVACPGPNCPWG